MASQHQDVADRIGRLARAIASAVKRSDKDAIVKWSLRMADASTSLAVAVSPALAKAELAEIETFDAPSIDPAYFVMSESGDEVYIPGFDGGLPGEGVDWTLNNAIAWFRYVWANGIGYHAVAPGLLPGSYCLTPEGLTFARDFQKRPDLTEAPRDFNPLGLPVKQ